VGGGKPVGTVGNGVEEFAGVKKGSLIVGGSKKKREEKGKGRTLWQTKREKGWGGFGGTEHQGKAKPNKSSTF